MKSGGLAIGNQVRSQLSKSVRLNGRRVVPHVGGVHAIMVAELVIESEGGDFNTPEEERSLDSIWLYPVLTGKSDCFSQ